MSRVRRLIFIYIIVLFDHAVTQSSPSTCSQRNFYVGDGIKDHVLDSRIFLTSTIGNHHPDCFLECTRRCKCLSFNVCGTQCQLNTDKRDMVTSKLKRREGCTYYDLPQNEMKNPTIPLCCVKHNPCHNGGRCLSPLPENHSARRFSCKCTTGFYGSLCEIKNPKTCADFVEESTKPLSGEYKILDNNGQPYSVFCDFDSEPNFAWTVVLSFSRDNAVPTQHRGLLEDFPVNEDAFNWAHYRLSLSRMTNVRQHSTHWRATCGYDVYGYDNQEYIRVNLLVVDFSAYYFDTAYGPTGCQTIEYMNIFGTECHNCNFALYHNARRVPGLGLLSSKNWSYCTFDLSEKQRVCGEYQAYLFFVQLNCIYPDSKCQSTGSSTTQHWFGSKIALPEQ